MTNFYEKNVYITNKYTVQIQIINNFQDLTNFWRRIGAVRITIKELKLEKENQRKEINYLRKIIKDYLSHEKKTNLNS